MSQNLTTLRQAAAGIVLAGGRAQRLGSPKALVRVGGLTLLERVVGALRPHCAELILALRPGQADGAADAGEALGMHVTVDTRRDAGPLGGLQAGLALTGLDLCFVTGTDYPFLSSRVIALLLEQARSSPERAAIVPMVGKRMQPLQAVWRRRAWTGPIDNAVAGGGRSPTRLLEGALLKGDPTVELVAEDDLREADPQGLSFFDVDSKEQLREALRLHLEADVEGAEGYS